MAEQALAERPAQSQTANALEVISRAAENPNVDPDKFQKLLDIQRQLQADQAERDFSAALADMQADLPQITAKGEITDGRGNVRSRYARFEDINEAIKPILKRHGFSVSFRHTVEDGKIAVTCQLLHASGHREGTTVTLPADPSGSKNNVQAVGSSLKYAQRYALTGILNITTGGEDDDGSGAGWSPEPVSAAQLADIEELMEAKGANPEKFCAYFKIKKVADLPAAAYDEAMAMLKSMKARK